MRALIGLLCFVSACETYPPPTPYTPVCSPNTLYLGTWSDDIPAVFGGTMTNTMFSAGPPGRLSTAITLTDSTMFITLDWTQSLAAGGSVPMKGIIIESTPGNTEPTRTEDDDGTISLAADGVTYTFVVDYLGGCFMLP